MVRNLCFTPLENLCLKHASRGGSFPSAATSSTVHNSIAFVINPFVGTMVPFSPTVRRVLARLLPFWVRLLFELRQMPKPAALFLNFMTSGPNAELEEGPEDLKGLLPRVMEYVFKLISRNEKKVRFTSAGCHSFVTLSMVH
jgi:hypothetical protein